MAMHDAPVTRPSGRWWVTATALVVVAPAAAGQVHASVSASVCRAAELRLVASDYGEAGGQFRQTFTFTNVGRRTCLLAGWPSLKLRSPSGRAVSVRSVRVVQGASSVHPFRPVVLRRGRAASFDVYGADWDFRACRACPATTAVFVSSPGASALSVIVKMPYCGAFYIAPIIAGKTDHQSWSIVWHR